jgi:dolichol-phosphate mannosyltransferase
MARPVAGQRRQGVRSACVCGPRNVLNFGYESPGSRHMRKISIVIPVYRNEKAVTRTYEKLRGVFESSLPQYDFEIIYVNDGSDDNSLPELLALRENDKRVKVLSFTRNFGQMAAMLAGFKHATGDAMINISADLQDPVELFPQMVSHWEGGSDVVICYRTERADSLAAKIHSRIAYGLLRLSIPQLPPGGFDFVLMSRRALDTFNSVDVRNRFFQGDLLWAGYPMSMIPYVRRKRTIGRSQYTFWKKTKNFLDAFLDASYLPIRFISALGMTTALLGFLYALTVVASWLCGGTPFTGWAPLIMAVMIVGGLNMLMLGIVGEYVWRIYDEVRKKPNYIIDESHL